MKKSIRLAAIFFLFFNGLTAVYGGGSLIIDPSGKLLQIPIEYLEDAPFKDFLIPGIILFTVNGLFNLAVGVLGMKKYKMFPFLTISCGMLLIIWLTVQIVIIRQFYAPAHIPYYIIGILMMILGFVLKKGKWSILQKQVV
jgi:hypothetical protein